MTGNPTEPYDFVPLGDRVRREKPTWHHRYHKRGHSGHLECRLTAKTPLFTYHSDFARRLSRGHEQVRFPVFKGIAIIPGSSLKGVLRSVAEAIAPGCLTLPTGQRTYRGHGITRGKSLTIKLPCDFEHCHSTSEDSEQPSPDLCPTCRLFGSLYPGESWAYAGKVAISDAEARKGQYKLMNYVTLDVLSAPKPESRPNTYTTNNRYIAGRKFYRHRYPEGHPDVLERSPDRRGNPKQDNQNKTVQPVDVGSQFTFHVDYEDISREELALLLYTLVLEKGLWHKIGMGKPLGLGSAVISITSWQIIDRQERYRTLGGGTHKLEGDALQRELETWIHLYRERQTPSLRKLRELLCPDPEADVRYQTGC